MPLSPHHINHPPQPPVVAVLDRHRPIKRPNYGRVGPDKPNDLGRPRPILGAQVLMKRTRSSRLAHASAKCARPTTALAAVADEENQRSIDLGRHTHLTRHKTNRVPARRRTRENAFH